MILNHSLQRVDDEHGTDHCNLNRWPPQPNRRLLLDWLFFLMITGVERFFNPQQLFKSALSTGIGIGVFAIILIEILVTDQKSG